ncbi:MAG TPA: GNAT family N-acetyltransferase [Bdellovibrionota bacterium]|jgi:RimJ/RimL family protein N-acetyltransferase|nr:GNAT family N-acetyltransferase [Bdellovibrionota bacterium]
METPFYQLPRFETERLLLRPFRADEVHLMRELDTDPDVVRYLGHGAVRTESETQQIFDKIQGDYAKYGLGLYAAFLRETGEFVGRTGIIPWMFEEGLSWEVGYTFAKKFWGQGFATEAAKFLSQWGLENIQADYLVSLIKPDNVNSISVARKAGLRFWKEGELKGSPAAAKLHFYRIDR